MHFSDIIVHFFRLHFLCNIDHSHGSENYFNDVILFETHVVVSETDKTCKSNVFLVEEVNDIAKTIENLRSKTYI